MGARTSSEYTGCVSTTGRNIGTYYNVASGNSPLAACKAGDYQTTVYDKSYLDLVLNDIWNSVNSLTDRVTNLENYQYNYISGDFKWWSFTPSSDMVTIANYTFYLPQDSYIYVQTSGSVSTDQGIWLAMGVDGYPCVSGGGCFVDKLRYIPPGPFQGFEISGSCIRCGGETKAGYHYLYLMGGWSSSKYTDMSLHFNVITTQRALDIGSITSPVLGKGEKKVIATYKNGKITIIAIIVIKVLKKFFFNFLFFL